MLKHSSGHRSWAGLSVSSLLFLTHEFLVPLTSIQTAARISTVGEDMIQSSMEIELQVMESRKQLIANKKKEVLPSMKKASDHSITFLSFNEK